MDYSIRQQQKRTIAGFHLVGPWEKTVKQGFEQLVMWVDDVIFSRRSGWPFIMTIRMTFRQKSSAALPP